MSQQSDTPKRVRVYYRRLTDKILIAFEHACEQRDLEVAERLAGVLEMTLNRRPVIAGGKQRRLEMEDFLDAHERLWLSRNSDGGTEVPE